jgi:3-deoxy-D-manno-octulosonic-acid transferase
MFVALLVASPWYLAAAKRRAGLREKLGRVPARLMGSRRRCIWVHAVSVGEVLAVSRLIPLLANEAGLRVVISTTTVTGQKLAREKFGEENVLYFPFDLPFAIQPYLRTLRPEVVVLAESEFWPNFLRLSREYGAHVAVVNARISDRSLPRYLRLHFLWRGILRYVELFLAQTAQDAERLRLIGADATRVHVTGNLKFDVVASREQPLVQELRQQTPHGTDIMVAGSTGEGEEALLLDAFRQLLGRRPGTLLILAPRHPERFAAVAELVKMAGLPLWRRSQLKGETQLSGGVLLLDSIGELAAVYSVATVAFVGGSLVPRGGHNILEAAQHGVPIIVGPHTENFREVVAAFDRAEAVRTITPAELPSVLLSLLENPSEREALGSRALEQFQSQAGATSRTLDHLTRLLRPTPARGVAAPVEAAR